MQRTLSAALVSLALAAPLVAATTERDPHSYARPDQIVVTHFDLDLVVDFEAHRLAGSVELTLDHRAPADRLWLDTRGLEIEAVELENGTPASFELGPEDALLGRALAIPIARATRKVTVRYRTSPAAAGLLWLEPRQTAGGRHPFLFSQSQAILARTWVPCQDTPSVRQTYSARLRVPPELLALMSAENPQARRPDGVYEFRMERPIPSYLLAVAVGDLEFRSLGPRTGVYADPTVVDAAAWEFADVEKMVLSAEALYGPYRWGRYDLLVLPPSFPYGGMENPRLTFATPTILAGDRSLVSLVAHELAHSWSGNLVTNATWNDFWLNEGFTTYFENRIMEAIAGERTAAMLAYLERSDLVRYLDAGGGGRESWLYADLAGKDPDEVPGEIVYGKGMLFLRTLEKAAGRDVWDAFLHRYFNGYAFRSMTTAAFVEQLRKDLLGPHPEIARKVDVDAWIYGPGLPADESPIVSEAFEQVDRELARLAAGTPPAELDAAAWGTQEKLHFLAGLPETPSTEQLAALDGAFGFTSTGNSEIFSVWAARAARARYAPIYAPLESFLLRVGRGKFLGPLYRALQDDPGNRIWAEGVYRRARPGYFSTVQGALDALLAPAPAPATAAGG
ncbi:MAG: leukotriene A4 hydrolase C-terminal domain-containing protein [Acidobacteria bacterium]|nr:leukotriene A4 hydrolase C-terminal domain-containing protein [Acidobacteriota bacterium]